VSECPRPALLLSHGLKRAGAQKFAVISAIGPVATLFLAWAILGERQRRASYRIRNTSTRGNDRSSLGERIRDFMMIEIWLE
jgi:hypothetical protein